MHTRGGGGRAKVVGVVAMTPLPRLGLAAKLTVPVVGPVRDRGATVELGAQATLAPQVVAAVHANVASGAVDGALRGLVKAGGRPVSAVLGVHGSAAAPALERVSFKLAVQ